MGQFEQVENILSINLHYLTMILMDYNW